ncbi:DUF1501 domain-containing protein [Sporocytophaga myxococcoides]|nr:DUF1501 domain-containing protein [Sporocytophaga myxococcoides]
MDRRSLIKGCAEYLMTTGLGSDYFLTEDDSRETIVIVFLRGGMDGLNFLAPVDDSHYRAARGGKMALQEDALKINQNLVQADFRLHPEAYALKELYENKSLALIHAAGLTNGTRSHFEAQDLMELGSNSDKNLSQGWLTRYLQSFHKGNIVPAYAIGSIPPASLLGSMEQMNITEMKNLSLDFGPDLINMLSEMYGAGNSLVHRSGKGALQNIAHIAKSSKGLSFDSYTPDKSADYYSSWPGEELSSSFKTVAQLIKMEAGLKIATIDYDGWDMHDNQEWKFPRWIQALSWNLNAFYNDIHAYHKKVTIVLMTEFGRRLKANKSGGTDHGHGSVMMVLGGNVNGGNMYGSWPGLANEQLDNGVDLAVTTDYRTVLSEIMVKRNLVKDPQMIFPKFNEYKGGLGIIR